MNSTTIKLFADHVITNGDNSNLDLFSGVAGNCIFFYELSRALNNDFYQTTADRLLDKLFESKSILNLNTSFGNGLAGIGWCLEYLLKQGFCEGNRDEILEDIDNIIFRAIYESKKMPIDLSNGLLGYLIYIISRLEYSDHNDSFMLNAELLKILINKIDNRIAASFHTLMRDTKFDLFGIFPILFYSLKKALELDIYKDKIINVIKGWMLYMETILPGIHSNRLSLAISLSELNNIITLDGIQQQVCTLLYSIDYSKLELECDLNSYSINSGWLGQMFVLKKASERFGKGYPRYKNIDLFRKKMIGKYKYEYINCITKKIKEKKIDKIETGLFNGLSGIAMLLLSCPECFMIEEYDEKI